MPELIYGVDTGAWELVTTHVVAEALPALPPPLEARRPVRLPSGAYVCGDHRDTASIQGALVSGRRAAQAVLADLGVRGSRRLGYLGHHEPLPPPGAAARPGEQADPVRRRRAQLGGQGLGRGRRPLVPVLPRRVRGRPAQPGHRDPLRDPQRAGLDPGRADVRGLARPRGPDARARGAAVHPRRAPPGGGLRPARLQLRHRARLHQHAEHARPGRHPDPRPGPAGAGPDRAGRRPRGVQPRAGGGLPGRRGAGGRRGGRADDLRAGPGLEGRGPAGRPGRAAAPAGR